MNLLMNLVVVVASLGGLFSTEGLARGYLSGNVLTDESCPGLALVDSGNQVECRKAQDFAKVKSAKVGANIVHRIENRYDAIELGVLPDADTSQIYCYLRSLLDARTNVVGYISICGYVNSEMDVKFKVTARYNLKGKLVSAKAE